MSRFCEIPYKAAIENNADLVIFQSDYWKHGIAKKRKNADITVGVVDEFSTHKFGLIVAWNKLYKKILFRKIRYPVGRVSEEVATTHRIVHISKRVYFLNDYLYHYVYRKGSISSTLVHSYKRDCLVAYVERYKDLTEWGYPKEKLSASLCGAAIGYLSVTQECDDELYVNACKIVESIESIPAELTWRQKIGLRAWKICKKNVLPHLHSYRKTEKKQVY